MITIGTGYCPECGKSVGVIERVSGYRVAYHVAQGARCPGAGDAPEDVTVDPDLEQRRDRLAARLRRQARDRRETRAIQRISSFVGWLNGEP